MATPTRISKLRTSSPELSRAQDNIARTLEPVAAAVGATPMMGAAPPPWVRPAAILNGFADLGGTVALSGKVAFTSFHKNALSYVYVKLSLTTAAGAADSAAVFVFPKGYRPSDVTFRLCSEGDGSVMHTVSIEPDGSVRVVKATLAGANVLGYFSFLAEQ